MNIKITKPIQGGIIKAIASKSEAHRLLICAALANDSSFITCPERSEDIDATIRCLSALGAIIQISNDGFQVSPIDYKALDKDKTFTLDCGESGATLRFMLPVCGALGVKADFHMSGRLPSRPLSALYDEMTTHGCILSEQGVSPLTCTGQLQSGTYTLPGNVSSQYISGLLLALPLLPGDSIIQITCTLESRPYVDMTLEALSLFGVKVTEDSQNTFRIPGNQCLRSPDKIKVGGDWSNAAFWLSAGAIKNHSITCTGIDLNTKQGDKAICGFLERFGANVGATAPVARSVIYSERSIIVSPSKLHGIEIDAENTPDLVPILAAVAAVAEGQTVIKNAGRLRIKESDRLHTVTEMLTGVGADVTQTEDGLIISGRKKLTGGVINAHGDHRIAMTAAILSSVCTNPVEIIGADAVNKSYPGFFEDFKALGGQCN